MKQYIVETLVSKHGNGDSYLVKEFDDLESAKEHLQEIKVELRELCDDLSNTWKDVIQHFGYAYNSNSFSFNIRLRHPSIFK